MPQCEASPMRGPGVGATILARAFHITKSRLTAVPDDTKLIDKEASITGEVVRVFFSNEKFSAGKIQDSNTHDIIGFAGPVMAREGDFVTLKGSWKRHPKFGMQIEVKEFVYEQPIDENGIVEFLARSKQFSGIGRKRARDIVRACNGKFEDALGDPCKLAALARVPVDVIEKTKEAWFARRDINVAISKLSKYGCTPRQAELLIDKFTGSVVRIIEENPYWLIGKISGFAFKRIDKIALESGIVKNHPDRIREAVLFVLSEQSDDGHTWTGRNELIERAHELLCLDNASHMALVPLAVEDLIKDKIVISESNTNERAIWRRSMYEAESNVLKTLIDRGKEESIHFEGVASRELALAKNSRLNPKQADAVAAAMKYKLSVLTGGAGVGKTFTIATIVECYREKELTVELCAPTGKAAQRMMESVGIEALTIHRLLEPDSMGGGASEGAKGPSFAFKRNHTNTLDCDLLVVDEVSMVDARLFNDLFDAVDWERTSVLLVGDHNQLPPVGPGAVLRDVVARKICPVSILTEVVRQAGKLKENVSAVLDGRVVTGKPPNPKDVDLDPWYVLTGYTDTGAIVALMDHLFRRRLSEMNVTDHSTNEKRPIDPVWDVQVLTPMHKGPIGTQELNSLLQHIYQESIGKTVPPARTGSTRTQIMVGDKVIQTKNNYDIGIMNGTIGKVTDRNDENGALEVDFDGEKVKLTSEQVQDLNLAYALTVHKSQGSEFPIVIYICHKSQSIMHHRGLFYTAVSRARKSTIVIGDTWGIHNCVKRIKSDARRTLISRRYPLHASGIGAGE